jgi:hypothetical protein
MLSPTSIGAEDVSVNVTEDSDPVYGLAAVSCVLLSAGTTIPLDCPMLTAPMPFVGIAAVFAVSFALFATVGVVTPDATVMVQAEFGGMAPDVTVSEMRLLGQVQSRFSFHPIFW